MQKPSFFNRLWDNILIFLLFQEVFVPFWAGNRAFNAFVLALFILTALARGRKLNNIHLFSVTAFSYITITVLQGIIWGWSAVSAFNSLLLNIFQAFMVWALFGRKLFILAEKVYFRLILVGLLFWFGVNLSNAFEASVSSLAQSISGISEDTTARSIVIFTHWAGLKRESLGGISRFCGFFHEPGAMAFFTTLLATLRFARTGRVDKRILFYFLLVIITFSSAGYGAFGLLIVGFILNWRSTALKYLMIIPIVMGLLFSYIQIEFMQKKIENQVTDQTEMELDDGTVGRIIGIRKAIHVLSKYPLHGRGLLKITQPESIKHPEYAAYGWTSWMAKTGVIFGLAYLFYFIRGFLRHLRYYHQGSNGFLLLAVLSLFINLTSQAFIESLVMMVFFYTGLTKYT